MKYTPGPYSFEPGSAFPAVVVGKDGVIMARCDLNVDAERIAYCLRIVEESEATDAKS